MAVHTLTKLSEVNRAITSAVGSIIVEFDIKSAYPSAMYFIKGPDFHAELLALPKLERNTRIGKMMAQDKTLYPKIEELLLSWMNRFLEENNIKTENFLESNRDSILLVGKKPLATTFENGIVEFRNKSGEFTSFHRINGKSILFDSFNFEIEIKGISQDKTIIKTSYFVEKYLKPLLKIVENTYSEGLIKSFKNAAIYREKYIHPQNPDIWRDLLRNNKFVFDIEGQLVESDSMLDENRLVKIANYKNFVMPVLKSILLR
jgi:hypothetical protein